MKVIVLRPVAEFIDALDTPVRADVYRLIELLEQYGHALPMPYAKPIGRGLRELRYTGRPHVRILFGFCKGNVVLVHAIKKQRAALTERDLRLAERRFAAYCA